MAADIRLPKLRRTGEPPAVYARKERSPLEKMIWQTEVAISEGRSAHRMFPRPPADAPKISRTVTVLSSQPQEAQHQGARPYQEDHLLHPVEISFAVKGEEAKATLFGLFDGHGEEGQGAIFVREQLPRCLEKLLTDRFQDSATEEEAIGNAFTQAFAELAKGYGRPEHRRRRVVDGQEQVSLGGGTTVCCGLRFGKRIYFANVGDSRAVLLREADCLQLTEDASLRNARFTKWHVRQNNIVGITQDGTLRVWGGPATLQMGLARAVGSNSWMCCRPKITFLPLGEGEEALGRGRLFAEHRDLLLFVSDGVTPRLSNEALRDKFFANRRAGLTDEQNLQNIAEAAGAPKGSDNSSLLLVPIRAQWMP